MILDTVVNTIPVSIAVNVELDDDDYDVPVSIRIDGNKLASYKGAESNRRTYQQGVHEISV